jgi:hypothetical protein
MRRTIAGFVARSVVGMSAAWGMMMPPTLDQSSAVTRASVQPLILDAQGERRPGHGHERRPGKEDAALW